jgi:hypothetical protein
LAGRRDVACRREARRLLQAGRVKTARWLFGLSGLFVRFLPVAATHDRGSAVLLNVRDPAKIQH